MIGAIAFLLIMSAANAALALWAYRHNRRFDQRRQDR